MALDLVLVFLAWRSSCGHGHSNPSVPIYSRSYNADEFESPLFAMELTGNNAHHDRQHNQYSRTRIFDSDSNVRFISSMATYGLAQSFCIKLSPDGKFLATGDEDGILEVRNLQAGSWKRVCLYTTGSAIRSLVWHPTETGTVFSGSANGGVHKVTVVLGGNNIECDALVPGNIHLLQLSPNGKKLVISYGRTVSIVDNPFPQRDYLGTLINLDIPVVENPHTLTECYVPRGIFFPPKYPDIVVIVFLGRRGIRAYSAVNGSMLWTIPLRENSFVGSSTMSPSGERIAVMNLRDGIDFYSVSGRRYLSTTQYEMTTEASPQNLIVDVLFIDDETVAFGHVDGFIGFAMFGFRTADFAFDIEGNHTPIRAITFGFVENKPLIFGLASVASSRNSPRYPSDIFIGRVETPGTPDHDHHSPANMVPRSTLITSRPEDKATMSVKTIVCIIGVSVIATVLGQMIFKERPLVPEQPEHSPSYTSPRVASIDPPHNLFTATTLASNPRSTCYCTVTGTFDAAESGVNN